jgi:hypothetical protein
MAGVGCRDIIHHRGTEDTEIIFFFPLPGDDGKGKTICRCAAIVIQINNKLSLTLWKSDLRFKKYRIPNTKHKP